MKDIKIENAPVCRQVWKQQRDFLLKKISEKESKQCAVVCKDDLVSKPERKNVPMSDYLGYPVRAVIRNSPAYNAGLRVGDYITAVNGITVSKGKFTSLLPKDGMVSLSYTRVVCFIVHSVPVKGGKIGVIANREKAKAYLAKLETKKVATPSAATKPAPTPPIDEDYFVKLAKDEIALTQALLDDMKARDALVKARDVRRRLQSSIKEGTISSEEQVNNYLNEHQWKPDTSPEVSTLTRTGKIVFSILGFVVTSSAVGAIAYYANLF